MHNYNLSTKLVSNKNFCMKIMHLTTVNGNLANKSSTSKLSNLELSLLGVTHVAFAFWGYPLPCPEPHRLSLVSHVWS